MDYLNETVERFRDLIKRGIVTNVSMNFPAKVNDKEELASLFIFPMGSLLTFSDAFSSKLMSSLPDADVEIYNIESDEVAFTATLPLPIDDAFFQGVTTITLEATNESFAKKLEEFYASKFHRVVTCLTEL